jgi:hypothetical protein
MAHPEEPTLPEEIPVQRKNKNINNVLHDISRFLLSEIQRRAFLNPRSVKQYKKVTAIKQALNNNQGLLQNAVFSPTPQIEPIKKLHGVVIPTTPCNFLFGYIFSKFYFATRPAAYVTVESRIGLDYDSFFIILIVVATWRVIS